MGKDPFAAAERHLANERRSLKKDRTGDYRRALGMTDALFGNIMGDVRAARGRLTKANARDLSAIQRLMAQARGGVRGVGAAQMAAGGHTAAADYVQGAFQGARATAAGGLTADVGQAQAGSMQAAGSQAALDMIRGTVKATGNAADYAAAQALSTRATQDAATIGAQQHDIDMARIQYAQQQALERQQEAFQEQMMQEQAAIANAAARRDFHYSMKLQQANLNSSINKQLATTYGADINSLSNATSSALRVMQSIRGDNIDAEYAKYQQQQQAVGGTVVDKTTWLAQTAAAAIGVGSSDPAMAIIARLAGTFIAHDGLGGPGQRAMVADTIVNLLQAYPQFRGKPEAMLRRTVEASLKATVSDINAQQYAAGPATGAGGKPTTPPAPGYTVSPGQGATEGKFLSYNPSKPLAPGYIWNPTTNRWEHFEKWDPKVGGWVTWK